MACELTVTAIRQIVVCNARGEGHESEARHRQKKWRIKQQQRRRYFNASRCFSRGGPVGPPRGEWRSRQNTIDVSSWTAETEYTQTYRKVNWCRVQTETHGETKSIRAQRQTPSSCIFSHGPVHELWESERERQIKGPFKGIQCFNSGLERVTSKGY